VVVVVVVLAVVVVVVLTVAKLSVCRCTIPWNAVDVKLHVLWASTLD